MIVAATSAIEITTSMASVSVAGEHSGVREMREYVRVEYLSEP